MDKHKLVVRLGASENLELAFNLSKLPHVSDSAFNTNLVIFAPLFLFNTAIYSVSELLASHANKSILIVCQVLIGENICFASNSYGSFDVISCNHANIDASEVATTHGLCDTWS